jgi:hypothetical protein
MATREGVSEHGDGDGSARSARAEASYLEHLSSGALMLLNQNDLVQVCGWGSVAGDGGQAGEGGCAKWRS